METCLYRFEVLLDDNGNIVTETSKVNFPKLKGQLKEAAPDYDSSVLLAILVEADAVLKDLHHDLVKVGKAI